MNNAVHYEDALMVKAAWYYYFENMTQQAIADRLSISRMRVIKLLDAARQNGVIQFRLRSDSVGMMEQSRELMQKYRLKDVFIIPEAEQESQLNESIAARAQCTSRIAWATTPASTRATATRSAARSTIWRRWCKTPSPASL